MHTITETYSLPLGVQVIAHYDDIGPEAAPASGTTWPADTDWPRVRTRLCVATVNAGAVTLAAHLYADLEVFGERLHADWGIYSPDTYGSGYRGLDRVFRAARVADAYEQARAAIAAAVSQLYDHLTARVARLTTRDATVTAARGLSPFGSPEVQS